MHPLLARGGRLALYVVLWALVGTLLGALLAGQEGWRRGQAFLVAVPLGIAYGFFCLSAWYVTRSMPLATADVLRVSVTALSAATLSGGVWLALSRAWMALLARRPGLVFTDPFGRLDTLFFSLGLLLYLLSMAVSYLVGAFEDSRETERRGLEVQVLAREAELRSLRAQIDPHFLFNSLHSISALTVADPAGARRMCVLLGDFLRETVALGSEARIPLDRELHLARQFLDIERVRFGDRLRAEIAAAGAGACLVAPLLLQPLVENAVTHGVAQTIEGGTVRISAERLGATLRLVVENPCDPDRPRRTGTGVGIANVRARLRALYGSEAHLSASELAGVWRVDMTMPVDVDPDAGGGEPDVRS